MFELEAEIILTKQALKEAEPILATALQAIKEKTASHGSAFEFNLSISQDKIRLAISSKSMSSCNNVLLPFEKQASEELGRKLKVGIREVKVDRYEVSFALDSAPKEKIKVPYAYALSFSGTTGNLEYRNIPMQFIKDNFVDRTIRLVKDKARQQDYGGKDEYRECIWEGKQRPIQYNNDPAEELEKIGWIKRAPGKGQFIYGPEFSGLMNVFKELLFKKVYSPLGFREMVFPKFEPWELPKKSGHAKNIYPNAYFVMTPQKADPKFWEDVMDEYAIKGEIPTELIKEKSNAVGIMTYAQCPPFWPYLEGKIIDEATLPLKVFDWSGPTYRNESGGTHGLDRVEEFHRIEVLFVGTRPQVVGVWKKLSKKLTVFFDKTLDLEIRMCKVTPWWMAHAGLSGKSENPDVGTHDFDAYLPFRGDRSKEWLEIQNNSSNGDKYPLAFNAKSKDQKHLWSGCAGNSLERLIVAFLSQKGLDPKAWPVEVRKRFEAKTKGIIPLKFY